MTMARGKQTCRILKEIRRQIAEANDIEYITSECRYKGDCLGTCPKCEAEVRYLEQQLRARSLAGKAVSLAGISATVLAVSMPMAADAQTLQDSTHFIKESIPATEKDTVTVKGVVLGEETSPDGTISKEPIINAVIINPRSGEGVMTDMDGKFCLSATVGDSLAVSFIGYETREIVVTEDMRDIIITLASDMNMLPGVVVVEHVDSAAKRNHYLDLNVFDESGNRIGIDGFEIERVWIDEDGEENYEYLNPSDENRQHPCRIYWDYDWGLQDQETGKPLKEATLRITAEGYEPVIIKVKYPKRNARRTIRLKHMKSQNQ